MGREKSSGFFMRKEAKMSESAALGKREEKDRLRGFVSFDPMNPLYDIEAYVEPQIDIAVYALDTIVTEFYDLLPEELRTRPRIQFLLNQTENVKEILENASRIIPIISRNYAQAMADKQKGGA